MSEIENQLENLGSAWFNSTEKVQKMQIESQVQNLKQEKGFTLALCNLISKPQTSDVLSVYLIGIMKEEAKILFSTKKKCIFGKQLILFFL